MIDRCTNPKNKSYARYGALGIAVCERWNLLENFVADMGQRPSNLHSLDRIDSTKGYFPENCRWATRLQQGMNQRFGTFVGVSPDRVEIMGEVVYNRVRCKKCGHESDCLEMPEKCTNRKCQINFSGRKAGRPPLVRSVDGLSSTGHPSVTLANSTKSK